MGTYANDEITVNDMGKLMKKESRTARRRKNFSRLLKRLFALAFLAAVVIFAAMSPFFNVSRINVTGNERYGEQIIIDASGIMTGVNLFRVNAGSAAAQVRDKCPYIETVTVARGLPSTITLKVTERKPFGVIEKDGNMIMIDPAGHVLEINPEWVNTSIPRLAGLDFAGYEAGKKLVLTESNKLQQIMDLVEMLKREDLYSKITMMDVSGFPKVNFEIDGRIAVKMGIDKNVSYKFSLFKEILSKTINNEKGQLEISDNGKANFVPRR